MDSIGELIGKVDPVVEREKRVSPRRKSTWKSVNL